MTLLDVCSLQLYAEVGLCKLSAMILLEQELNQDEVPPNAKLNSSLVPSFLSPLVYYTPRDKFVVPTRCARSTSY